MKAEPLRKTNAVFYGSFFLFFLNKQCTTTSKDMTSANNSPNRVFTNKIFDSLEFNSGKQHKMATPWAVPMFPGRMPEFCYRINVDTKPNGVEKQKSLFFLLSKSQKGVNMHPKNITTLINASP